MTCTQGGRTGNDPGIGGATASFPITFSQALTGLAIPSSYNDGAFIYELSTSDITVDSTNSSYGGNYYYAAIGK